MKNNFHIFRSYKRLKIQNSFIFVDTEAHSNKITNKKSILSFRLCCSIFWNKEFDKTIKKTYYTPSDFWNDVENWFNKRFNQAILYAHNTQFDFKILNGFTELLSRGWSLASQYIKNTTFILVWKKGNYTLHIWDTMNYVPHKLKEIGKSVGFPKLDVDFNTTNDSELETYCKRDTEIIYQFIRKLLEFLETNDLSRLKATAGSLSLNVFRHNFYDSENKNERICIHDWKQAIKLERKSYKGGITDLFRYGTYKHLFKLDINSMYPAIMKDKQLPNRLICYRNDDNHSQKELRLIYNNFKGKYLFIMDITIKISKENAYILHNFRDIGFDKSVFAHGEYRLTICQPEVKFIEQYGKIKYIHQLTIYETSAIFRGFVDFFYKKRLEYKKSGNLVNEQFCKLLLNTQYGKWGQRTTEYKQITPKDDFYKDNRELIYLMLENKKERIINDNWKNAIISLGSIVSQCELYLVNGKLYYLKQTQANSKDTFVAIASFITSYSRMLLIKYLKIAKRSNVFYADTDSLFVNQEGYYNLKANKCIHKTKLGKLKVEGTDGIATFYSPKFYDFNELRKCKGVKKDSVILLENKQKVIYQIESWQKFKTDLRKGYKPEQLITITTKEVSKLYTKGKVDESGYIHPFSITEIQALV